MVLTLLSVISPMRVKSKRIDGKIVPMSSKLQIVFIGIKIFQKILDGCHIATPHQEEIVDIAPIPDKTG